MQDETVCKMAAQEDESSLPEIRLESDLKLEKTLANLLQMGGEPVLFMLKDAARQLFSAEYERCLSFAEVVLNICWEKLNTGHWKDVNVVWREAYSYSSLLKALALCELGRTAEAITSCDMGLLMGAPVLDNALGKLVSKLQRRINPAGEPPTEKESFRTGSQQERSPDDKVRTDEN